MRYQYYIFDVFSSGPFGGNQLAVLPDARGLTTEGMQAIAREFNFAETTFVLPPSEVKFTNRVRIFTPAAEVTFAGHPTIGTACALAYGDHLGSGETHTIMLEEGVGPVEVQITHSKTVLSAMLTLHGDIDQPATAPTRAELAEVLSVTESVVLDGFFASVGLPFCYAHLADKAAVDGAAINMAAWNQHLSRAWSPNIFFFSGDLQHESELYARMSAPALGVPEDPATGSACAALVGAAANAAQQFVGEYFRLSIVQGVKMGRRSDIEARACKRNGRVTSVSVGGPCAYVASGEIEVPNRFMIQDSSR
jgi:trans-2,3-dihydro-3-hydroxyanthranilate isomerase